MTTQTATRDPLFPFLAESAAIAAAHKQRHTAEALYLCAFFAQNDVAAQGGEKACQILENTKRTHAAQCGPWSMDNRPDYRAAADAALSMAENEPEPVRAQCARLMWAHAWNEITRGTPDHASAGRMWKGILRDLRRMEK